VSAHLRCHKKSDIRRHDVTFRGSAVPYGGTPMLAVTLAEGIIYDDVMAKCGSSLGISSARCVH